MPEKAQIVVVQRHYYGPIGAVRLPPGEHTVSVSKEGFLTESRLVTIRSDETTELFVELRRDEHAPDRLVAEGDRLHDARFYARAADLYRQALEIEPDAESTMDKLISSLFLNGEVSAVEALAEEKMKRHGRFWVDGVSHIHRFGRCRGKFTVAATGLSFEPLNGNHGFVATKAQIRSLNIEDTDRHNKLPNLTARIQDGRGRERKLDFVAPVLLNCASAGHYVSGGCSVDDEAVDDTQALYRFLIKMAEQHVH